MHTHRHQTEVNYRLCQSGQRTEGERAYLWAGGQQRGACDKKTSGCGLEQREGVVGAHDGPPWKEKAGQVDREKRCGKVASGATFSEKASSRVRCLSLGKMADSVIFPCTTRRGAGDQD